MTVKLHIRETWFFFEFLCFFQKFKTAFFRPIFYVKNVLLLDENGRKTANMKKTNFFLKKFFEFCFFFGKFDKI